MNGNIQNIMNNINTSNKYTINEIDEGIANYLNKYNHDTKLRQYASKNIIFCYKKKLYLVLHYLIKNRIYNRYTYEIWYATRNIGILNIINHAREINSNFKVDADVLIYVERDDIVSILNAVDMSELIDWHNTNYWYIYYMPLVTNYIKQHVH